MKTMNATNNASNKNEILSEKVSKSLSLRIDTAQMMNALAALSSSLVVQQQEQDQNASKGGGVPANRLLSSIDAKAVRGAIEYDALLQAKEFEEQLRVLVGGASRLREQVEDVSRAVHALSSHTGEDSTLALAGPSEREVVGEIDGVFQAYTEAKERASTVSAFLERFEIGPEDAALLESFDFLSLSSDVLAEEGKRDEGLRRDAPDDDSSSKINEFLDALDRINKVRLELSHEFKSGTGVGTTSAIKMMESLGSRQEKAYEKIYQWIQVSRTWYKCYE